MTTDMQERTLASKYIEADKKVKELKDELKTATDKLEKAKATLIEHLEEKSATATATYEGLGRVQINKPRVYASVNASNLPVVIDFLNSIGRDDLVKTVVNPQSLSSFVAESIESGTDLPSEITYYLKPQLRVYA